MNALESRPAPFVKNAHQIDGHASALNNAGDGSLVRNIGGKRHDPARVPQGLEKKPELHVAHGDAHDHALIHQSLDQVPSNKPGTAENSHQFVFHFSLLARRNRRLA